MLGRWDDCPIDPAYYIEDCRISTFRVIMTVKRINSNFAEELFNIGVDKLLVALEKWELSQQCKYFQC